MQGTAWAAKVVVARTEAGRRSNEAAAWLAQSGCGLQVRQAGEQGGRGSSSSRAAELERAGGSVECSEAGSSGARRGEEGTAE